MTRLAGKSAIVTGAGNGIGRACALTFAREGATVVVTDVQEDAAAATAAHIERGGGRAVAVAADSSDPAANDELVRTAVRVFGGLDVLVTAAGIAHAAYRSGDLETEKRVLADEHSPDRAARILDLGLEEWNRVLEVNLTGTLLAVQAAARRMVEQRRGGSIVTVASIAAKHPDTGRVAYGVSKAGVWMLTKQAASSLGAHGIRVNSIGPGLIDTNMLAVVDEVPGLREKMLRPVPLRRFGTADEVAAAALFLASDDSGYVTGEMLHPSGGYYVG
jgi:NAD(P)-dependent dehydrogenase (short-subunit alcohol dehydrogenase family)